MVCDFKRAGTEKAINRAKNNKKPALFATEHGYINSKVVKAMLEQEAHYVRTNPGKYIKGYNEAEAKFKFEHNNFIAYNELNEQEKSLVNA